MDFLVGGTILITSVIILAGVRWVRNICSGSAAGCPKDATDPFTRAEAEMFSAKEIGGLVLTFLN